MLKTVKSRQIVRSSSSSRGKSHNDDKRCIYSGCYTIEPGEVQEAWDTLSTDTFAIEIASYPALFHNAFLSEMRKRMKHA
jgi:hypothetical protein